MVNMKKMMTGKTIALLVLLALIATSFVVAPTVQAESDAEKNLRLAEENLRLYKAAEKNMEQYLPLLEEIDSMLETSANSVETMMLKGRLQAAADIADAYKNDPLWELFVAYKKKARKVLSAQARVMDKIGRYQRADKPVPRATAQKMVRYSALILKLIKKQHAILTRLERKYLIK